MFKAIKDNKIIAISEKKETIIHTEDGDTIQEVTGEALFPCLEFDEVIEDTEHTVDDYKCYDGEFTLHDIDKDNEYAKQARARAYQQEVDPITSHIQRLRDEEGAEKEIAELINERALKVEEIKQRYPYSEIEAEADALRAEIRELREQLEEQPTNIEE